MSETNQKRQPTKRRPRNVEAPVCHCGSGDTYIYKTIRRLRYWKCRKCGDTGVISGPPARDIAETVDEIQER